MLAVDAKNMKKRELAAYFEPLPVDGILTVYYTARVEIFAFLDAERLTADAGGIQRPPFFSVWEFAALL